MYKNNQTLLKSSKVLPLMLIFSMKRLHLIGQFGCLQNIKYARLIHNQYEKFYLNKNSKTRLNVTWFRVVVSNPLFQRNALHTNCDTWKNCHFYTFFSNKYCMHICILTRAFENTWSFSYFDDKSFKMFPENRTKYSHQI